MEQQPQTDRTLNKMRDIPARAEDVAYDMRAKLDQTVHAISRRAGDAAKFANQRVQANPWTAVGIGFGAGMVLGALLTMAVNSQRTWIERFR